MGTQSIPPYLTRYFWGDNVRQLNVKEHQKYIVQTLLEIGNNDAIQWLFSAVDKQTIKKLLPSLKLSKKSANFWNIYFS